MNATRFLVDDRNFLRSQRDNVFQSAIYLANRMLSRANKGETPYKL